MKLLVTRPLPDAEQTAERLRRLGHEVTVQPLLRTEFLPLTDAVEPAALAVTSRNGVRAMAAWPAAKAWRQLPLYAVGEATAAAAGEAGFTDVHSADGDGAALAALIIATRKPEGGPILYPAAEDRSPVFETRLGGAGFAVDTVIAYRMVAAATLDAAVVAALQSGDFDGVLLYSRRSAETFLHLVDRAGLGETLSRLRLFVLSPAVASVFSGRAVGRIDVAPAPREDVLIGLIPALR
jgi:uroporphyrinogen-III synthase